MRSVEQRKRKKITDHLHYLANKERIIKQNKEWAKKNPEKCAIAFRKSNRKQLGAVNPTGEARFGPCEICTKICELRYDHDHKTGVFRGWLCCGCNVRLGFIESPLYKKAIEIGRASCRERV